MTRPHQELRLVQLSAACLEALVAGNLDAASAHAGQPLTPYLVDEAWLWRMRLEQLAKDPSSLGWIARAAVDTTDSEVVGHVGFHGPPDERGMVEVAYAVDPARRRQGYATSMLATALGWAAGSSDVEVVRASISPGNKASLATIAHFGFEQVGTQWDEEDGLELLFERTAR